MAGRAGRTRGPGRLPGPVSVLADIPALPALPEPRRGPVRALAGVARALDHLSTALVRIAWVGAVIAALVAFSAIIATVFTRYVLGFSLVGAEVVASFAFLWAIWLGVSVAVRRGAVTVITVLSHHGPGWWQRSARAFSGVALGVLLAYCVVVSTRYATSPESVQQFATGISIRKLYPIASMPVGYYFISVHYLAMASNALVRTLAAGSTGRRQIVEGLAGGALLAAAIWAVCKGLFAIGTSHLVVIGLLFVVLTLAGTPVVFMLSIVGIVSTKTVAGLSFYPLSDELFPFRQTQTQMGLNGASELLVILMFLIVAEVMNQSGMSDRLIRFAASLVGHLRGGTAYVCQLTSMLASGISGSAQADAAIMTPLLVPAMEKDGYPRDMAAAVVAGASIKGPIGPISIMFIFYAFVVETVPLDQLLLSGVSVEILLFLTQAMVIYWVVRRRGFFTKRRFAGLSAVGRATGSALPVLLVPVVIIGGIFGGVFTASESAAVAVAVSFFLAFFWFGTMTFRDIPRVVGTACVETGIVMLLLGDSAILSGNLKINGFGEDLEGWLRSISDNKYVFLLIVNLILLAVGIFIEPLPALFILGPFLAPIADQFGIDPVQFGLVFVFNLVLALIHPPIGLVLFLVSSISKVSIERLSITILPWLAVSLLVLFLVTYLPASVVLWLPHLIS